MEMIKIRQKKTKQDRKRNLENTPKSLNISNKTNKDKQDRPFQVFLRKNMRTRAKRAVHDFAKCS